MGSLDFHDNHDHERGESKARDSGLLSQGSLVVVSMRDDEGDLVYIISANIRALVFGLSLIHTCLLKIELKYSNVCEVLHTLSWISRELRTVYHRRLSNMLRYDDQRSVYSSQDLLIDKTLLKIRPSSGYHKLLYVIITPYHIHRILSKIPEVL